MINESLNYKIYKDADRRQLLIRVAKMYYHENMSQNEIADAIGLSRSNISKMLQSCKDMNIVEIHINETTTRGIELMSELEERFDLEYVNLVPSGSDSDQVKIEIGKAAAQYVKTLLVPGMKLGISWGSTLYQFVENFHPLNRMAVDTVQIMGGIGARDLNVDGIQLAYKLANKLSGRCTVIHAPLFVQNRTAKEILLKEPGITAALNVAEQVDIALIGIGTSYPETNALIRAGYISKQETEFIQEHGAVGNILGRLIDSAGNLCKIEMNDRVIGLDTEKLKSIPLRIGIAGGVEKTEAILGALRKKYINSLITDENTAVRILQGKDT